MEIGLVGKRGSGIRLSVIVHGKDGRFWWWGREVVTGIRYNAGNALPVVEGNDGERSTCGMRQM